MVPANSSDEKQQEDRQCREDQESISQSTGLITVWNQSINFLPSLTLPPPLYFAIWSENGRIKVHNNDDNNNNSLFYQQAGKTGK